MDKLFALRALMSERGLDAYIVPSGDAHAGGYVSEYWRSRAWLTGFTGSAGLAVVTRDKAGLWTDGRYFIQAARELEGSGFELYKSGEPGVTKYSAFLAENLPKGGKLGFDGRTTNVAEFERLKQVLKEKNIAYSYLDDLVGELWTDRPPLPAGKAFEHEPRFAGRSAAEKLKDVRAKMKEKGFAAYLVTALDDVAWLANIRGRDIPNIPVIYAYALLTENEAHIFADSAKVAVLSAKLRSQGFILHEYNALPGFLSGLEKGKLYYNSAKTNVLMSEAVPGGVEISAKADDDIIPLLKAVKSPEELANIKNAFIKEGVVLVKMLKWLDESISGGVSLAEADVARTLTKLRGEQEHYFFDSFSAIAAYGKNAAEGHYRIIGNGAAILPEGFLLVDTGGQYLDGTTDTTRTIPVGELTDEMRRDFTLVLKGHIAMSRAVFISGTTGTQLDILARLPMWEDGQNFRHGTGHGIGFFLGVHEGPQGISQHPSSVALAPGMLLTNEPGIYKEGRYGIRTENVLLVVEKQKTDDGTFLAFETITFCPFDLRAIDAALLTETEREWLNEYHFKVRETLMPLLDKDEQEWLENSTRRL